jgi:hypothetical protein
MERTFAALVLRHRVAYPNRPHDVAWQRADNEWVLCLVVPTFMLLGAVLFCASTNCPGCLPPVGRDWFAGASVVVAVLLHYWTQIRFSRYRDMASTGVPIDSAIALVLASRFSALCIGVFVVGVMVAFTCRHVS